MGYPPLVAGGVIRLLVDVLMERASTEYPLVGVEFVTKIRPVLFPKDVAIPDAPIVKQRRGAIFYGRDRKYSPSVQHEQAIWHNHPSMSIGRLLVEKSGPLSGRKFLHVNLRNHSKRWSLAGIPNLGDDKTLFFLVGREVHIRFRDAHPGSLILPEISSCFVEAVLHGQQLKKTESGYRNSGKQSSNGYARILARLLPSGWLFCRPCLPFIGFKGYSDDIIHPLQFAVFFLFGRSFNAHGVLALISVVMPDAQF
jgi:hypothetical protein